MAEAETALLSIDHHKTGRLEPVALRMPNTKTSVQALLISEGSGGHLIPALEVAERLAGFGVRTRVWYAQRTHTAPLSDALAQAAVRSEIEVEAVPSTIRALERLWHGGVLWRRAQQCFDAFAPDVVAGFGGWLSVPVLLAARSRGVPCLIHEQNVVMGRANRWLAPWVHRVAVSFEETEPVRGSAPMVITGMPVRAGIGQPSRTQAAQRFGFNPMQPTILVLGGSQGARALNDAMAQMVVRWSPRERQAWQVLHLTGHTDEAAARQAYAQAGVRAWVASFLVEMEDAYTLADVVIARAGASTIAELAQCGTPAILIPYPYAGGHQRANAHLVEAIGGGVVIEETDLTPQRLVGIVRRILGQPRLRGLMGVQMQALHRADAVDRLAQVIVELARAGASRHATSRHGGAHG